MLSEVQQRNNLGNGGGHRVRHVEVDIIGKQQARAVYATRLGAPYLRPMARRLCSYRIGRRTVVRLRNDVCKSHHSLLRSDMAAF